MLFRSETLAASTPHTKHSGGDSVGVTPVPIPNTAVKPYCVDGTARETVWESRSLPDFKFLFKVESPRFRNEARAFLVLAIPCSQLYPLDGGVIVLWKNRIVSIVDDWQERHANDGTEST